MKRLAPFAAALAAVSFAASFYMAESARAATSRSHHHPRQHEHVCDTAVGNAAAEFLPSME